MHSNKPYKFTNGDRCSLSNVFFYLKMMYQTNFYSCHRFEELSPGTTYHWSYSPNPTAFNLHQPPQNLSNPNAEFLWSAFHEASGVPTSYSSFPQHSHNYNSGSNHLQVMQCQNRRSRRQQNCPYPQTLGIISQQLVQQPGQVKIDQTIQYQSSAVSNTLSKGEIPLTKKRFFRVFYLLYMFISY